MGWTAARRHAGSARAYSRPHHGGALPPLVPRFWRSASVRSSVLAILRSPASTVLGVVTDQHHGRRDQGAARSSPCRQDAARLAPPDRRLALGEQLADFWPTSNPPF
jgi:hypothetical protein